MNVSPEMLDAIMQGSWVRALRTVDALERELVEAAGTPAASAAQPAKRAAMLEVAYMTMIADALYLTNVAISRAIQNRVLPSEGLQELEQQAANFTVAALSGKRFFCDAKPCDWRGTLEQVGPCGFCPTCKGRTLKPSPEVVADLPGKDFGQTSGGIIVP